VLVRLRAQVQEVPRRDGIVGAGRIGRMGEERERIERLSERATAAKEFL
jgi:hypothetical protein